MAFWVYSVRENLTLCQIPRRFQGGGGENDAEHLARVVKETFQSKKPIFSERTVRAG